MFFNRHLLAAFGLAVWGMLIAACKLLSLIGRMGSRVPGVLIVGYRLSYLGACGLLVP